MAIVRYQRKPLTQEQIDRLSKLKDLPDEQIDFSDIPDNDDGYEPAVRGLHYRPVKQQVTVRFDADIIDWFKRKAKDGKGYQTDINRALREYIAAHDKKAG